MSFSIRLGFCNVFALPIAISSESAVENDGFNALSIYIGPFVVSFEWEAA